MHDGFKDEKLVMRISLSRSQLEANRNIYVDLNCPAENINIYRYYRRDTITVLYKSSLNTW